MNYYKFFILLLLFIFIGCSHNVPKSDIERIAVIGALDVEIENLKNILENSSETNIAGIKYYTGKISGKDIVLLKSGVGKVNAAVATTLAIENFNVKKIIFTGVAGGANPNYEIGDIVISDKLIEHDFDTSDLDPNKITVLVNGYDDNFYPADKSLIEIARQSAEKISISNNVYVDTIATGDQFIGRDSKVESIHNKFKAGAIEMEGASVAHVALMFDIPFVVIRALSDKANSDALVDFPKFLEESSKTSSKIVIDILQNIN